MKKYMSFILVIAIVLSSITILSACDNAKTIKCTSCGEDNPENVKFCSNCGKEIEDVQSDDETNEEVNDTQPLKCAELDCDKEDIKTGYCEEHTAVYEHEREFYPEIQKIISALNNQFGYSVSQRYQLKEIVVSYQKATQKGKDEYGLADYYLTFYIYYELNGVAKFAKYDEYVHLIGITPKIEVCAENIYTSYRKVAMGGSESSLYHKKLRSQHYANESILQNFEYDEFFIVNFNDYKKQGYTM
jgi:hypothetical protein